MSRVYTLKVPDDVALDLEANDDVEIYQVHDESPQEKQEELQERMGLDPSDEGDDSKGEAELTDLQREQLISMIFFCGRMSPQLRTEGSISDTRCGILAETRPFADWRSCVLPYVR